MFGARRSDPTRLLLGLRFVAALFGAYVGKLRTEQNKLRGIVNPYQNHNERRRRTVGGFEPLLTDIKADQKLPDLEQRVGVVVQLKDAFNTVWEVAPEKQGGIWGFMRTYILSLAGVLAVGFLRRPKSAPALPAFRVHIMPRVSNRFLTRGAALQLLE